MRIILIIISCVLLTNCTMNRSHFGAVSGGATGVAGCVAAGASAPYVTGACAIVGAFAGADVMYK